MFDRLYVIHLPNEERRQAVELECEKIRLEPTFIHAKCPDQGFSMTNMRRAPRVEFGLSLSHVKAVIQAMDDGAERPLFIEDDIRLLDAQRLWSACDELPEWDVLYLGGHPRSKVSRYSEHLVKVGTFSFAEAYSINRPALSRFLSFWFDRIGRPHAMFDFILGEFAAANRAYCVYPVVTEQPPNVSQVSGKLDDKRELVKRGWAANL